MTSPEARVPTEESCTEHPVSGSDGESTDDEKDASPQERHTALEVKGDWNVEVDGVTGTSKRMG